MIRIYKRDFRAWLTKNQGRIVGNPGNVGSCPLCRFLKSKGAKNTNMQITCRTVDGQRHNNSAWMRNFQNEAMRLKRRLDVTSLRGREALEALEAAA